MTVEPITKPRKPSNDACPHVVRAINLVTAELAGDGIDKTRKNQQQGYAFRGIDEVLNALARILADQQLVIVPHITSREITERQTKQGGALFSVTVTADYTFISAVDGSERTVGPFYGEAMDSADKATNKAMSAAYKYMAIQTFCIPTKGDNDADNSTHEVAPAAGGDSPAQPPPRQQPSSASAKRDGTWERFTDKLNSLVDAGDIDDLERWWKDAKTQSAVDAMPSNWIEQAHEAYEKAQEQLLKAGAR